MKRFRYVFDGLFILTCCFYALNRWVVIPRVHSPFLRYHFNDMLLIPCALPPLLWFQRLLKLRDNDDMPTIGELSLYCLVWSILFEVIGPHIMKRATGDPWDVVAYVVGGVGAGLWWHRHKVLEFARAHGI